MSYPNSHMAYTDCFEVMDRALADEKGVRLLMADRTAAEYQRTRINYARKMNRRQNEKIYSDPEHPLHGASAYDKLVCRIKQYNGKCWLYVEHYAPIYKGIEDLTEIEPEPPPDAPTPAPVPIIRAPAPIKSLIWRRI
jgi:hypothetical protein